MDDTVRCDRCRYWISLWTVKKKARDPVRDSRERRSKRGQCHRHAPQASALTVFWPWTQADDRCGDFQPREEEKRTSPAEA